ncbi:MAG: glycosyltransferase family 1 protein [Deltaproteobacteria bacterium]|nr:glycosyltransferase family 1 protein [Deltaproteobacteria bacterium]
MKRSIVVLCIHGVGHLRVVLPVVAALHRRGWPVHVLTHAEFRDEVERSGARFIDLFARYPLEAADASSQPLPSRYVSFAGVYGEALAADIAALDPGLIVCDTFMVAGPVVARLLDIPYVNVLPNHAPVPSRTLAALRDDPRVSTSSDCWNAIRRLREVYGMVDAHPLSYVDTFSPYLNLYAEPAEFLDADDRRVLQPLEFFGCLTPELRENDGCVFPQQRRGKRIYVCFGTVVWWYFEAAATKALRVIAQACEHLDVDVVVSLGRHRLDAATRKEVVRRNVTVVDAVDQWAALREADVFITHHGINSTHEAIFQQVPMLSYPFFGDQPALATRCQQLGLALPLARQPRGGFDEQAVRDGFMQLIRAEGGFMQRLAEARRWELRTIAARDGVVDRILALIASGETELGAPERGEGDE